MLQDEEAKATGRPAPPLLWRSYRGRWGRRLAIIGNESEDLPLRLSMQEDIFLIGSIMKEIVEPVFRQSKRK